MPQLIVRYVEILSYWLAEHNAKRRITNRENTIVHGIATSGRRPEIDLSLAALGIGPDTVVVERGDVLRAKPELDLFLVCQERLGVQAEDCYVVGDAVWDRLAARQARMLSIGLLSGGYGEDELTRAALSVFTAIRPTFIGRSMS